MIALKKIVSGGQTGVDRAALDVAMQSGLPIGGWCPRGRLAEDGAVPELYPLQETDSPAYPVRTSLNVRDSDGTLILNKGQLDNGTLLTLNLAKKLGRPYMVVQLDCRQDLAEAVGKWIVRNGIRILNVAGPRESKAPGIYEAAFRFCEALFRE